MVTTPNLWKGLTQVNTTDGGTAQLDGQVAGTQDGGYEVVWTDYSHTYNASGGAIVGQHYDIYGQKVGGEVKVSVFVDGDQSSPAMTALPNGNVAVAYIDVFAGVNNIDLRTLDGSGNPVSETFLGSEPDQAVAVAG